MAGLETSETAEVVGSEARSVVYRQRGSSKQQIHRNRASVPEVNTVTATPMNLDR